MKIANRARRPVISQLHQHRRGNRELVCLRIFSLAVSLHAAPQAISFSQSSDNPEVYDYIGWFNAFTGESIPLPMVQGPDWTSPRPPGWLDWGLLSRRES